jgi:hypothetical protein
MESEPHQFRMAALVLHPPQQCLSIGLIRHILDEREMRLFIWIVRLYPRKLAHFSPLGRVVADFFGNKFFQNVATHLKY